MLSGGDPVTGKEHHGHIMFGDGMHYPVEAPENRIFRCLAVSQSLVLRIQNDFFVEPARLRLGQRDEILRILGCEMQTQIRVFVVADADCEHVKGQLGFDMGTCPLHTHFRWLARAFVIVGNHRDCRVPPWDREAQGSCSGIALIDQSAFLRRSFRSVDLRLDSQRIVRRNSR